MAPIPTDRELEALKILWERREATVREIFEAIDARRDELAYTTILSLIQTMEQKGLIKRIGKAGKAQLYVPCVPRDKTLRGLAEQFLDRVFDGAIANYVLHAIDSRKISPKEWDQIEQLLHAAKKSKRTKKEKP